MDRVTSFGGFCILLVLAVKISPRNLTTDVIFIAALTGFYLYYLARGRQTGTSAKAIVAGVGALVMGSLQFAHVVALRGTSPGVSDQTLVTVILIIMILMGLGGWADGRFGRKSTRSANHG